MYTDKRIDESQQFIDDYNNALEFQFHEAMVDIGKFEYAALVDIASIIARNADISKISFRACADIAVKIRQNYGGMGDYEDYVMDNILDCIVEDIEV